MIHKYFILEYPTAADLEKNVNKFIAKGFKPMGGVAHTSDELGTNYVQALYSEEGIDGSQKWGINE
jgi:hypothetical protein